MNIEVRFNDHKILRAGGQSWLEVEHKVSNLPEDFVSCCDPPLDWERLGWLLKDQSNVWHPSDNLILRLKWHFPLSHPEIKIDGTTDLERLKADVVEITDRALKVHFGN